jgi:hypothetical protein
MRDKNIEDETGKYIVDGTRGCELTNNLYLVTSGHLTRQRL